jgi:hypothetical protein
MVVMVAHGIPLGVKLEEQVFSPPSSPTLLALKAAPYGLGRFSRRAGEGSFVALHVKLEGFSFSHLWEKVSAKRSRPSGAFWDQEADG